MTGKQDDPLPPPTWRFRIAQAVFVVVVVALFVALAFYRASQGAANSDDAGQPQSSPASAEPE